MKKEYYLLFVAFVLIFLSIATTFGSYGYVGNYGMMFASANIHYFGLLAHIYLVALLYPLYRLYKSFRFDIRRVEITLSSLLLFFSLLMLQALTLQNEAHKGEIAQMVISTLNPLIGVVGIWIALIFIASISLTIAFDLEFDRMIIRVKSEFKKIIKEINSTKDSKLTTKDSFEDTNLKKTFQQNAQSSEKESFNRDNYNFENSFEGAHEEPSREIEASNHDLPDFDDFDKDRYDGVIKVHKKDDTNHKIEESKTEDKPIYEKENLNNTTIKEEPKVAKEQIPYTKEVEESEESVEESSKANNDKNIEDYSEEIEEDVVSISKKYSTITLEVEENSQLLDSLDKGELEKPKDFKLPTTDFLSKPDSKKIEIDEDEIDLKISNLLDKLHRFKIEGDVVRTYVGPVVTTFEFKPAPHIKVSKILTLEDDLAMALKAKTIRIQAPVPGKDVVGIEIPNSKVETIYLREVLEDEIFRQSASPLTIALGKDIVGKPFVTDLKKLPHLLIAGTTGSGKSVGINSMIISLLYRNSPKTLRLLMIDPKMLEFSIYNDIPHLLTPVITQPKKAVIALSNMVLEMERRNDLMARAKTKNIENYNQKAKDEGFEPFPFVVVVIDELADLMMTSGKDVEYSIARLAQMARASGIHLIVATQRPSVDVVTGLIKANLPSRIGYKVGQKIDSKVILDSFGAESLLGRGDMLFTPPGMSGLVRLHAPWCSESEIENIVEFLKSQQAPNYDTDFLDEESDLAKSKSVSIHNEELDELYNDAREIVLSEKKTSISYIQRRLQIGYNRAANIVEQLASTGVLSEPNSKGVREIL